jgi:hypothetical protein
MTSPVHKIQQIENIDVWVGELKKKFDKLDYEISSSQKQYRTLYPDWDSSHDARSAWFTGMLSNCLPFAVLDLYVMRDILTCPDTWQKAFGVIVTENEMPDLLNEYDIHLRFNALHSTYAMVEAILRRILATIDAEFYVHQRKIGPVTNRLLGITELTRFENLFKLARTIRNSVHNNGVYYPSDDQNCIIKWNDKDYTFHVGESVEILDWDFLIKHWHDLNEAITAIIMHQKVATITSIPRKY